VNPSPGTNARRISRPVADRIGMFWMLGFWLDRRPVTATVWLNSAWIRPVRGSISGGSAST